MAGLWAERGGVKLLIPLPLGLVPSKTQGNQCKLFGEVLCFAKEALLANLRRPLDHSGHLPAIVAVGNCGHVSDPCPQLVDCLSQWMAGLVRQLLMTTRNLHLPASTRTIAPFTTLLPNRGLW